MRGRFRFKLDFECFVGSRVTLKESFRWFRCFSVFFFFDWIWFNTCEYLKFLGRSIQWFMVPWLLANWTFAWNSSFCRLSKSSKWDDKVDNLLWAAAYERIRSIIWSPYAPSALLLPWSLNNGLEHLFSIVEAREAKVNSTQNKNNKIIIIWWFHVVNEVRGNQSSKRLKYNFGTLKKN